MSLFGTLSVGKTALAATQIGLQTTGNNIANAGNADYTRQRVDLSAARPQELRPGMFVGTGVNVDGIQRQVDEALLNRLRASISDQEGSQVASQWISRLESTFNELTDDDLSTALSTFFNSWSELANKPQDLGLRQVVVQEGQNIAQRLSSMRTQFQSLLNDTTERVKGYAIEADKIASEIAVLNTQIATSESGLGGNNGLRDNRDTLLKQLAGLANITTQEDRNGMVNVYLGSSPLVLGGTNRGLQINQTVAEDGLVDFTYNFKDDNSTANITGGVLGGISGVRDTINDSTNRLDDLASSMIFELNKIHSSGQGLIGFSSIVSQVTVPDTTVPLTDEAADLDFVPSNGSFVVHVTDKLTGATSSDLIQVDLDGLNADDMSLDDLAAALDAVDNISASVVAGKLNITADSPAVEFSFSQDSSGVLASLGVGTFFSGKDASNIAIRDAILNDPRQLAAARNGRPGDNQSALAIAALEESGLKSLNGQTLKQQYEAMVNDVASKTAQTRRDAESARAIRETLEAQRESISGVSLDEEAINLLKFQRAYQGAAKVIQATDELLQTLMNLV